MLDFCEHPMFFMLKRIKNTNILIHSLSEAEEDDVKKLPEDRTKGVEFDAGIQCYVNNQFAIAKDFCGNKLFISDSKFFH